MLDKNKQIENLTGVNSSKLNYYIELKQRNREIVRQNNRLEIIHQIAKDINIDMSIEDIIGRVYQKLPLVIDCDFLGLALFQQKDLVYTAMVPFCECTGRPVPKKSLLWEAVRLGKGVFYRFDRPGDKSAADCPPVKNLGLTSMALDPLLVKGKVIGILMIGSVQSMAYSHQELKFIQQLADQLAICIENAKLYDRVLQGRREWEETFQALTDPIFLIDLNYNVTRCNNRLNSVNMGAEKKTSSYKCYSMLWGRKKKCETCLMEEVFRTGTPAYRRILGPSGQVLDIFYYPVFNEEKKIYAVIHHIKDMTEQVKMEAQLVQSAKLAAIGEMAAGVAHELNNPMTVIIGNAQMLLREMDKENPSADLLNDIVNCGLRCKKIIQNLLTFSRQDHPPMAPTDLNKVVERVLSLIRYQINRSHIAIRTDFFENLPMVMANGHQLDQVLLNLLLNARDALDGLSREKEIKVSTSLREEPGGRRYVQATVEDNGIGIPPGDMANIFNPFFTSKESSRGTGLGLSVSLGIAEAHGGRLEASSRQGEGSVFSLALPLENGPEEDDCD